MATLNQNKKTLKMVYMAFFIALIVVLQMLAYVITFLPVAISLVFIPIVAGGTFFGKRSGAILGCAFGIITFIGCITGIDIGGAVLFQTRPIVTFLLCIIKATLAGFLSAVISELITKNGKNTENKKIQNIKYIIPSFIGPFVNTFIFCVFMFLFYKDTLAEWAGGSNVITYTITGLVGFNFLFEVISTMIVAPIVIVNLRGKVKL